MKVVRPSKYTHEQRHRAMALVIEEGASLEHAAKMVGVAISTLKHWSTDGRWFERRKGREDYAGLVSDLKLRWVQKASTDPLSKEDAETWAKLENTYPERHYAATELKRESFLRHFDAFTQYVSAQGLTSEQAALLKQWIDGYLTHMEG